MTRTKAFLIHLGISFLIFLVILYFTIFHWYPDFLFIDDGGLNWLRLIAGISLIFGPLLTLLLFKPGKWGLKFDVWVIAIIHSIALGWITWITYQERPYVIVFAETYFKPLTKEQFLKTKAPPGVFKEICKEKPCLIFSQLPEKIESIQKIRAQAFRSRIPVHMFGQYYKAFSSEHIATLQKVKLNVDNIINKNIAAKIKQKFIFYREKNNRYLFFRISSRYKQNTVVFDKNNYRIVDTINYSPQPS